MAGEKTLRAECRVRLPYSNLISFEQSAMARSQLSEGAALDARKRPLRRGDWRRKTAKQRIGAKILDRSIDYVGVNLLDGRLVLVFGHDAVHQERCDSLPILCQ